MPSLLAAQCSVAARGRAVLMGLVIGFVIAGCGGVTKTVGAPTDASMTALHSSGRDASDTGPAPVEEGELYDPWERFNEKMFAFNQKMDTYVLKPVAGGYRTVVPEQLMIMIDNAFRNITWLPRFVNSLLQGKWEGALREVSRFVLNSTLGFGGLFDPGKYAELQPSKEDFGQTLATWGVPPGPYLVLPLLGPTTVRDGVGRGVDGAMNPLAYTTPFIWDRLSLQVGDTVDDRALNYDLFEGVAESTIDFYSAVRHFYLTRRQQLIKE